MRWTRLGFVVAFSLVAAGARAQVATVATTVAGPFDTKRPTTELDVLTTHYNGGDWAGLQRAAVTFVTTLAAASPEPVKSALDPHKNHIALMWVGRNAFGETLLMRFIVHMPPGELFSPDLPGLHDGSSQGFFELLLTRAREGESVSVYASTRQNDPFLEGLGAFVEKVATPLFATFSAIAGRAGATRETVAPSTITATVKRVALPFKRASVTMKAVVRDPWFDSAAFTRGLAPLAARISFDDVPYSDCGRKFAAAVAKELSTPPSQCGVAPFNECQQAFDTKLTTVRAANLPSCEAATVNAVDQKFRTYVKSSVTSSVEQQLTFKNRPLTRFAFGSGAGVLLAAKLTDPRVALKDGILRADPLDRVMTTAYVNVSPRGYNPESATMSIHERIRPMFGVAMTPDFGVVAGANVLLVRGIGINAGLAILFAKGAEKDQIGKAPEDSTDPFKLSFARAPYIGISYNYR